MKINNINLNNSFIHYENQAMEFDFPGVYFIHGPNGAGKTTLMESILFDNHEIEFPNPTWETLYNTERFKLFSYVQQNFDDSSLSVKDFIMKNNPNVNWEEACNLLRILDFDESNYFVRFQSLSGGEKMKASIASAFIKNTPYVFLDEPTNYLDNTSVERLISLINAQAKNKVVIVVSHDDRLRNVEATRYYLDGKQISKNGIRKDAQSCCPKCVEWKRIKWLKIALSILFKPMNIAIWVLCSLTIICSAFLLQLQYSLNYVEETAPEPNVIIGYSADCVFSDLNRKYCENVDLQIDENNYYSMVNYNDIPFIAQFEGCKKIYILDFPKMIEYLDLLHQQQIIDREKEQSEDGSFVIELQPLSIPQRMYSELSFMNAAGLTDFVYLERGRLPLDDKNEVSISKRLLRFYFGYSENEAEEALGNSISIGGEEYIIVGINYLDVCLISDSVEKGSSLLYAYSLNTAEVFFDYYNKYLENNDYYRRNIEAFFIVTEKGFERKILNTLMKQFPANNYYSYEFAEAWAQENNSIFLKSIWIISLVCSLFIGVSYLMIKRQQSKLNTQELREYSRYYMGSKKLHIYYITGILFSEVLLLGIGLAAELVFDSIFGMLNTTIMNSLAIVLILSMPGLLHSLFLLCFNYTAKEARCKNKKKSDENSIF